MSRSLGVTVHTRQLSRGWKMVATLAVTELITWGALFYAFGVLLVPMQETFGWSRGFLSAGISVAVLVSAFAAPLVGRWLDRFGARWLMTGGSVLGALCLLAWSHVDTRTAYLTVFATIGIAMATTMYEPAFAVAAAWFPTGLSRALLAITVGGGLASTVFLPLTAALVSATDWRVALVWLATILAVGTILPHAIFLRGRPEQSSVHRERRPAATTSDRITPPGLTSGEALRQPSFWWLSGALVLSIIATGAVPVHLVAFLLDRGYDSHFAALIAGLQGALSIVGRVLITAATRFVPEVLATTLLLGLQALSLVVLLAWHQVPGVVLFIVIYGATAGAMTIVRAAIVADFFGRRSYASIAGMISLGTTLARAAGPLLAGLLYQATGGYAVPFWGLVVTTGISAGLMVVAERHRPEAAGTPVTSG